MANLCLQEEEMLPEKVEGFPVLYDERVKVFKEKDSVQNAREKAVENLDFAESSNFIRESSNWKYFEDSCSKKNGDLFCVQNSYKILADQFDFRRCYFGFR